MIFNDFLSKNSGTWLTQRTTYFMQYNQIITYKSTILISSHKQFLEYNTTYCKYKYDFQDLLSEHTKSILESTSGQLEGIQSVEKNMIDLWNKLKIYMNKLNYASIFHSVGDLNSSEKVWLVNSNLRLSFSIIKKTNQCVAISFSSDIRIS